MIIALKSEDIPRKVYDEVSQVNVGGFMRTKYPTSIDDVIKYIWLYASNRNQAVIGQSKKMETSSFKLTIPGGVGETFGSENIQPPSIKIEWKCIDQITDIDNQISKLQNKRAEIIKNNQDIFRDLKLENLGI